MKLTRDLSLNVNLHITWEVEMMLGKGLFGFVLLWLLFPRDGVMFRG